jgi:hypothetical protein
MSKRHWASSSSFTIELIPADKKPKFNDQVLEVDMAAKVSNILV